MTSPTMTLPSTALELLDDGRFLESGWRSPTGQTFFDLMADWHGDREHVARMWWAAMLFHDITEVGVSTLTCDELADKVADLLAALGYENTPIDAGGETDAVDWFWAKSPIDAEVYVQQRLVYAFRRLGNRLAWGDRVTDARIALGAVARLRELQGGAA